jgi:hypothetical protein
VGEKTLVSVELVAKMEEEACRLARETVGGVEGEVRRDEEAIDISCIDFASDGGMVAGGTFVSEHGHVVGSNPEWAEDGSVKGGIGGSEVADGEVVFGDGDDFGEMEL